MKKAIVLGGTEDHINLIEILKNKGYYTILIDYYENPPAKTISDEHIRESALDEEKVLKIAKTRDVQLTMALCIDQAILTMAYVSEKMGTPCYLSYQQALWMTNKSFMKEKMRDNDIPTSEFFIIDKNFDLSEIMTKLDFPSVVKPVDSNSGNGVTKVENEDQLRSAIQNALGFTRTGKVIVEEYVQGDEYSAEFFIENGDPINIVTTKTFKTDLHDNKFITLNSMSPASLERKHFNDLKSIAKRISDSFRIKNGPLFIQFLKNEAGLCVVEFSSRMGGGSRHHFIRHATDFDYLDHLVSFNLGEKRSRIALNKNKNHFGCYFVYSSPGILKKINGVKELNENHHLKGFYYYKTLDSKIRGNNSSSHRVFCFIVEASSFKQLKEVVQVIDNRVSILDENNNDLMIHNLYHK